MEYAVYGGERKADAELQKKRKKKKNWDQIH